MNWICNILKITAILLLSGLMQLTAKAEVQPYTALDSGNAAYSKGDYAKAIKFYTQVETGGYKSAQVYYNMGNAYYKTNETAKAILYYERAKKLNPSDPDVLYNLQLANLKTTDKINPETSFFLMNSWSKFSNSFSEKGWSILCIASLCLCVLLLALYFMARSLLIRQFSFWCAMIMLAASLFAFILARQQYNALTTHDTAIVMTASVTVKAAPADNSVQLFVLHEGAKVQLVKTEGEWTEIKLANGSQGWMMTRDVEGI